MEGIVGRKKRIKHAIKITEEVEEEVDDMFSYKDWMDEDTKKEILIRKTLADAVKIILDNVPPSVRRTVAIRKIIEARMDCIFAISNKEKILNKSKEKKHATQTNEQNCT